MLLTVKPIARLLSLAVVISLSLSALNIQPSYAVSVSPKPIVTITQDNLLISATVTVAENQTVGKVTIKVGEAAAVTIPSPDADGNYSKLLTRASFGTKIIFSAVAIDQDLVTSEITTTSAYTFTAAAPPTAIDVTQDDLVVSAQVTTAPRTSVGRVTVKVGTASPITLIDDGSGAYSIELTRTSLGKQIIFTATSISDDALPDSDPISSSPFVLAVTPQPSAISVTQVGFDLKVNITLPAEHSIGTVTYAVGSSTAAELVPTGDSYTYSMDDSELSKTFIFTATAISDGPIESLPITSEPFIPTRSKKPVAISLTQSGWDVRANFDLVAGSDLSAVFYTVDGGSPVYVSPDKAGVTLDFEASDLGKVIVVQASAFESDFPESTFTVSKAFTISKSASPASITLNQSGLVVTATVKAPSLGVITSVKVSLDGAKPTLVSPVDGIYRVTLTRSDFGKPVTFTATSRKLALPESDEFSSAPLIFSVASSPSFVSVTKSGLVVSAVVAAGEGQSMGPVFVSIDGRAPKAVSATRGVYALTITREDIGKQVIFSATATKSFKAESDVVYSTPVTVSSALSPTFGEIVRDGFSVKTTVLTSSGQAIKSVTVSVGSGIAKKLIAVNGVYVVKLVAADVGKAVVFKAIASSKGLPDSNPEFSTPFVFNRSAMPIFSDLNQNDYNVSVRVSLGANQTLGAVEYAVDSGAFRSVSEIDGRYSITFKRAYIGKAITFRAKAKEAKTLDSDYAMTTPLVFSAATKPVFTSITQVGYVTTATINAGANQTLEKVLVKVGSAKWRVLEPVEGKYSITGTAKDLGKTIIFSATALRAGLPVSDVSLSSEQTVTKALNPVFGPTTQTGLAVTTTIQAGEGQKLGPVYVVVGNAAPQLVRILRGKFSYTLTRADLGKTVTFQATAVKNNAAPSDGVKSVPFVFSAAKKPISLKVSQKGSTVSLVIKNLAGQSTGSVTVSIGGAKPKKIKAVKGIYAVKVTRAQVGKQIIFTATSVKPGALESDPTSSKSFKVGS